jgi:hypothetical protein
MKTTPKIATNFYRYRDSELSNKLQYIVTSMTGNAAFPSPEPAFAVFKMAADNFAQALTDASDRSTQSVANKNLLRKNAIVIFSRLARYIEISALGNELELLSSGFTLAKNTAPVGTLPKPTNFSVQSLEQTSAKIRLTSIYGAIGYQYEYKLVDAEVWNIYVGTKSSTIITDLTSGMAYNFRVAAIGTSPTRLYSDILTSYVL